MAAVIDDASDGRLSGLSERERPRLGAPQRQAERREARSCCYLTALNGLNLTAGLQDLICRLQDPLCRSLWDRIAGAPPRLDVPAAVLGAGQPQREQTQERHAFGLD